MKGGFLKEFQNNLYLDKQIHYNRHSLTVSHWLTGEKSSATKFLKNSRWRVKSFYKNVEKVIKIKGWPLDQSNQRFPLWLQHRPAKNWFIQQMPLTDFSNFNIVVPVISENEQRSVGSVYPFPEIDVRDSQQPVNHWFLEAAPDAIMDRRPLHLCLSDRHQRLQIVPELGEVSRWQDQHWHLISGF